eukprot:INCI6219.1.p1 GENE.INCI6219.1~~INCI6219.1.p1  ORF type:complete len:1792 (+),score=304.26 INCI6219.1:263-5638(+)
MRTLGEVLQCASLDILLQPLQNGTAVMNSTEHDTLRVNTCFEHGILQPLMAFLILAIALPAVFSCCSKKDDAPPRRVFLCCSFLTPLFASAALALVSFGIFALDWMKLPSPKEFNPAFYGNVSEVHDGTNGTMYLYVGDSSEIISSLLLAFISSKVVLTTGKTPLLMTMWVTFQAIFVSIEARLSTKNLLALYMDPSSASVINIEAAAPWEGYTEIFKEEALTSILRVARAVIYVILALSLLCRRETPKSTFDPREHMPAAYQKKHASKKISGPSPVSPGVGVATPTDESTVPDELRFSNERGGSICTRLMFGFISPLLVAGGRAALETKQIFLINGEDDAVLNARRLQAVWTRIGMKKKHSLIKSVLRLYVREIVGSGFLMLLSIVCTLLQPQALYQLLDFIQQQEVETELPYWWGYFWAFVGAICIFLQQCLQTQAYWMLSRLGYRLRGAMTVMLFEKSLRLDQPEMSSIGIGKIVNLAEVDAMKLMWSMYVVHQVWSLPLTLLVGLVQLYLFINWAAVSGIGVMALLFVPNVYFMKKAIGLIGFIFSLRDRRVKLLSEHVGGIRLIKMLGWEREKKAEVNERRTEENDNRWWLRFWFTNVGIIASSTPALINIATFCIYVRISAPAPLTAATGFTVLSLTGIIQGPASGLGRILQIFANINISLKRLEKFLNSDELTIHELAQSQQPSSLTSEGGYYWDSAPLKNEPSAAALQDSPATAGSRPVLQISDGSFQWSSGAEKDSALLEEGRKNAGSKAPPGTRPSGGRGRGDGGRGRGHGGRGRGQGGRGRGGARGTPNSKPGCFACCTGKTKNNDLQTPLIDPVASGGGEDGPPQGGGDAPSVPAGPTISGINLSVLQGQLVMIVGKVGSGKTTLLCSMLNEVPFCSGRVAVRGTRAYCSQVAWIQNLTVRDNILMGAAFDERRYQQAIKAACLADDLKTLPAGDATEIGERGISLSGGQKKRVAIARAVYSGADVYFLDDILSAVDAHVADHIMREGICGALAGRTRVLVTHAIHLLDQADHVVVMDQGQIVEQGSLAEIRARGADLSKFIEIEEDSSTPTADGNSDEPSKVPLGGGGVSEKEATVGSDNDAKTEGTVAGDKKGEERPKQGGKLVQKEEREYGTVKCRVWMRFFQNLGVNWTVWMIIAMVVGLGMDQVLSWWVTFWTDAATTPLPNGTSNSSLSGFVAGVSDNEAPVYSQGFYLAMFSAFNVLTVVMISIKNYIRLPAGYMLSERIHNDALWGVLRAPMAYFDTTKSGRIINKFSSDLATVDGDLMVNVINFVNSILSAVMSTVVVLLVCPVIVIIMVPVIGGFYFVQRTYRASIRELQRLSSMSRSPVFSAFSEALDGAATIRCFNKQSHFAFLNEERLRKNLSSYMNQNAANQWLSVRLVCLSAAVFFCVASFSVVQKQLGWNVSIIGTGAVFSSGMAGLALQKSLEVMSILEGFITSLANAETSLVAMERLLGFAKLEAEPPLQLVGPAATVSNRRAAPRATAIAAAEAAESDAEFPVNGEVEFRDVTMAYREGLKCTLRGVSFTVPSGTSVGIVGRTGAGKSSLIVSLFRLVRIDQPDTRDGPEVIDTPERRETLAPPPEQNSGQILIGGVDISTVGLHRLRRGLSIIPQEPELFSGTIRSNLDPWDEFTDAQIWDTLESCEMKQFIENQETDGEKKGLDSEVTSGGSNLSVGQRQLLCLARAILRRAKVLVMDEATGSVDTLTDGVIQRTLAAQAKETGCTVLTIAHRINTIFNNDLIIVMEQGRVVEMGPPGDLMQDPESHFASLARAQGLS